VFTFLQHFVAVPVMVEDKNRVMLQITNLKMTIPFGYCLYGLSELIMLFHFGKHRFHGVMMNNFEH
jgi:hypothetical protein